MGSTLLKRRQAGPGVKLLPAGSGKLLVAVALAIASGTGRRGDIGAAAESLVERGGRCPTVGDVGHVAKAHELDGYILVLFRDYAANGGVGRGQDAIGPVVNSHAVAAVIDAPSRAVAIRGCVYSLTVSIIVTLRRWQRLRVGEGILSSRDVRKR